MDSIEGFRTQLRAHGNARALKAEAMRRVRGMTLREIAQEFGFSQARAHQLVRKGERLLKPKLEDDAWVDACWSAAGMPE